jgi:DNA-binding GntR family transcriptional regulator
MNDLDPIVTAQIPFPKSATGSGGTLGEKAYELLRQDILSGALSPGMKLRIEPLRERYDMGASPLREALSRLVADGLVTSEERRGFRIPPVSLVDLRDIANMRKLLECSGLRQAIETADTAWESELLATYHRLSRIEERLDEEQFGLLQEWEERHREFHEALVAGAGSPWLQKLQRTLYDQSDRYRRLYLPEVFIAPKVHGEHKRILEAALARDAEKACDELANHIERIFETAKSSNFFRAGLAQA